MLSSCIRSLDLPLAEYSEGGGQPRPLFRGATPIFDDMACEAGVVSAGNSPYAPHIDSREELLIVLDGEAELGLSKGPFESARIQRVRPGDFAYYPAGQHHTISSLSLTPVTYLTFKWRAETEQGFPDQLKTTVFKGVPPAEKGRSRSLVTRTVFEKATAWLERLDCRTALLPPGASYAKRVHTYDVAVVLQSGCVETLGQKVGPRAVIYFPAGESYGLQNIGNEPARYLIFEFHAGGVAPRQPRQRRFRRLARRVLKKLVNASPLMQSRDAEAIGAAMPG